MACDGPSPQVIPSSTADVGGSKPYLLGEIVPCAAPELREQQPLDRQLLPGEPAAEHRFVGAGIVAADLDGEPGLELILPGPGDLTLWRLEAGRYVEVIGAVPAGAGVDATGAAAADADGDGDLDLVITRFGPPDVLLLNDGAGVFVDSGEPVVGIAHQGEGAAWGDLDGDGDLDLVIAGHRQITPIGERVGVSEPADPTRLLINRGDGTFDDATWRLPQPAQDAYTFVANLTDLDGDGLPDLVLANDHPQYVTGLAVLNRPGSFILAPQLGLDLPAAGMGLAAADVDGDGIDDFLIPVWDKLYYLRSSGAFWVDATQTAGFSMPPRDEAWLGWGAEWGDLDSDGDLDAVVVFGHLDAVAPELPNGGSAANASIQRDELYEQEGGRFSRAGAAWGLDEPGVSRGLVVADLDGDGWLDVARRDLGGPAVVHRSRCGQASWLVVEPTDPVRAIGAKVIVSAMGRRYTHTIRAGGTGLGSSGPPVAHFGLGAAEQIDHLEVRWPDGATTALAGFEARRVVRIQ